MKKVHRLIMLVAGLITVLGSGGWLRHLRYTDEPLNCISNMEWNTDSNHFMGTLSFRTYNSEGPTTITGKLYKRNTSGTSRNIYFNYAQKRGAQVLQAMQVVKAFADITDEMDINDTLSGFYRQSERSLSLVMEEYKGTWVFTSSNMSSLCCHEG